MVGIEGAHPHSYWEALQSAQGVRLAAFPLLHYHLCASDVFCGILDSALSLPHAHCVSQSVDLELGTQLVPHLVCKASTVKLPGGSDSAEDHCRPCAWHAGAAEWGLSAISPHRSLFVVLDSLACTDGAISAAAQGWLVRALSLGDVARILEPMLLLLLQPKTQRTSIQCLKQENSAGEQPQSRGVGGGG